jgi:U3 small nucleolar RNA-associated protein 15
MWDLLMRKPLKTITSHQKTITSLALSTNLNIISGSLDHLVKIYDSMDHSILQTLYYTAPISALDISVISQSPFSVSFYHFFFKPTKMF